MIYLKVRKIVIDVVPDSEPFISIHLEKITVADDGFVIQTVANFDRMYHKASEIPIQLAGDVASDGIIDNMELFNLVAGASYMWVMMRHGGEMIDGKLVVDNASHS